MADIRAFRGFRPTTAQAGQVASPPYDVLNSQEARAMAQGNPLSFLHICKPEIDLPADVDEHSEAVYQQGRKNLQQFVAQGILKQDAVPSLYIYSQRMGSHYQTGIVALASAQEYTDDKIKKHEHTRPDKVEDRTKLIATMGAHAEPVFLTYRHRDAIDALVKTIQQRPPVADFTSADGFGHTVWTVTDPLEIAALTGEMKTVDLMYIADGHHRSASAVENHKWDATDATAFFLAVIFPDNQLAIMDYNRAVKDLNGLSSADFMKKLETTFTVKPWSKQKPPSRHTVAMYLDRTWHLLTFKPEGINENDPQKRLDVSLLQENLLAPVLGIANPRTDKRIDFIGGLRGLEELERIVNDGSHAVAFAMFPVSISDLLAIADAGEVMPPKSTWFEPKLRSGLVVNIYKP
ncbi:MAG TPA: DUF1015 family protein [bacterium]|nr:DUF1015 family protein [bacterium]